MEKKKAEEKEMKKKKAEEKEKVENKPTAKSSDNLNELLLALMMKNVNWCVLTELLFLF